MSKEILDAAERQHRLLTSGTKSSTLHDLFQYDSKQNQEFYQGEGK